MELSFDYATNSTDSKIVKIVPTSASREIENIIRQKTEQQVSVSLSDVILNLFLMKCLHSNSAQSSLILDIWDNFHFQIKSADCLRLTTLSDGKLNIVLHN